MNKVHAEGCAKAAQTDGLDAVEDGSLALDMAVDDNSRHRGRGRRACGGGLPLRDL
jgi:hypothetical protein